MTADPDPYSVARLVSDAFDAVGVDHTVGGSIASSFAGEPRSTVDIDFVAALDERQVPAFVGALGRDFYADEDGLRRSVRSRTSPNLIHLQTMLKVDVFVARGTALDAPQIARRLSVDLGDGRSLHAHPPEDILLQKLRWYGESGGTSDRQWRDIIGIIRVQGTHLDRAYVRLNAPVLNVGDLLQRAFDEAHE